MIFSSTEPYTGDWYTDVDSDSDGYDMEYPIDTIESGKQIYALIS